MGITTAGPERPKLLHLYTYASHEPAPRSSEPAGCVCLCCERLPTASDMLTFSRPSWRD
jgi:hypothetical protein